ncbi:MAG: hypothetical protein IKG37_08865, partial [Solobacterium sp.]|nr:hypothetical protein [Solobacterium sp.]
SQLCCALVLIPITPECAAVQKTSSLAHPARSTTPLLSWKDDDQLLLLSHHNIVILSYGH